LLVYIIIFLIILRLFLSVLTFGTVGGTFGLWHTIHGCTVDVIIWSSE